MCVWAVLHIQYTVRCMQTAVSILSSVWSWKFL